MNCAYNILLLHSTILWTEINLIHHFHPPLPFSRLLLIAIYIKEHKESINSIFAFLSNTIIIKHAITSNLESMCIVHIVHKAVFFLLIFIFYPWLLFYSRTNFFFFKAYKKYKKNINGTNLNSYQQTKSQRGMLLIFNESVFKKISFVSFSTCSLIFKKKRKKKAIKIIYNS